MNTEVLGNKTIMVSDLSGQLKKSSALPVPGKTDSATIYLKIERETHSNA